MNVTVISSVDRPLNRDLTGQAMRAETIDQSELSCPPEHGSREQTPAFFLLKRQVKVNRFTGSVTLLYANSHVPVLSIYAFRTQEDPKRIPY